MNTATQPVEIFSFGSGMPWYLEVYGVLAIVGFAVLAVMIGRHLPQLFNEQVLIVCFFLSLLAWWLMLPALLLWLRYGNARAVLHDENGQPVEFKLRQGRRTGTTFWP